MSVMFSPIRLRELTLAGCEALPDHYDFSSWDSSSAQGKTVICTEKDAVKLWPRLTSAWAVPLVCELPPELLTQLSAEVQRLSLLHGQKTT